jgi:hypothetical protein
MSEEQAVLADTKRVAPCRAAESTASAASLWLLAEAAASPVLLLLLLKDTE